MSIKETCIVLGDFTAQSAEEISLSKGETIVVIERYADGWTRVQAADGTQGLSPDSFLESAGGKSNGIMNGSINGHSAADQSPPTPPPLPTGPRPVTRGGMATRGGPPVRGVAARGGRGTAVVASNSSGALARTPGVVRPGSQAVPIPAPGSAAAAAAAG